MPPNPDTAPSAIASPFASPSALLWQGLGWTPSAGQLAQFEAQRLGDLAAPVARAWRRDGIHSRIAAGTFYRWLAGSLWPGEVTDKDLLDFAMSRTA